MTVLVAKAVVDVVIVPLVQPVLWAEWVAVLGVVAFDLNTLSLLESGDSADLLLAHCAPALFEGYYCFGLMTCTAEQLSVKLLHEEEVVAEARQVAVDVLAFHGQ